MRKVAVWALRPGMEVARRIYDNKNQLLLNAGVKLESGYIRNLKKLNIPAIYVVNPLISDIEVKDVLSDETRYRAEVLAQKIITASLDRPREMRLSIPRLFSFKEELNEVVDEMIDQLLTCRELIINLSDIRTADNYTFAHSANVAVLSLMSATAMGLSRSELRVIGLGSFLHDLGKTMIDPALLNKRGPLLPEERKLINKHPAHGYELVRQQPYIDHPAAKIVYQHHERMNGKGYPEGLAGTDIHVYSRICAIADVYDALVSDRPYRPAYPPHRALEIFRLSLGGYDPEIFQLFSQHVAAYPVGTLVGLNCGVIGIVTENYAGYPTRPRVRIICEKGGQGRLPAYELDLSCSSNRGLLIDEVYEDQELLLTSEPALS